MDKEALAARFSSTKVLVVDDDPDARKVVRALLMGIGVRTIHEAVDGLAGLELIRTVAPDVVILDWEMPGLDGAGFVRKVRSAEDFPYPDVPIIMLTGHGERSRVIESIQIGVNAFLLKPVSSKALQDRLAMVLIGSSPLVASDDGYGPASRKLAAGIYADNDELVSQLYLLN